MLSRWSKHTIGSLVLWMQRKDMNSPCGFRSSTAQAKQGKALPPFLAERLPFPADTFILPILCELCEE